VSKASSHRRGKYPVFLTALLPYMRNGTKLKQLLQVCDINITLLEEGTLVITTINKATRQSRQKDGATFSAALDKAYRQMLKDAGAESLDEQ
jgi:hypothetical protein